MLAFLTLTTPLMLLGLAGLAGPLIAHWLNRRARKRIVFPTIRLLSESLASQSHLYRLRRWLLLVLRCLAIAAIVLAFAGPMWQDQPAQAASGTSSVGVVIVLDVSASSAQQSDGVALADSMRALANRTLDSLSEGSDVVDVVYAAARPRAAFGQLSSNFAAIRQELQKFQPTCERADLAAALAKAGEVLASHQGARRVVLLSDMQKSNWGELAVDPKILPAGTALTVVPVSAKTAANVALSAARVEPLAPIMNQQARVLVTVHNYTGAPRKVEVEASLADKSLGKQTTAEIEPGSAAELAFSVTFGSEGQHAVVFSCTDADSLRSDNHAFLAVRTVRRLPVAVVGDDSPSQPGSATYFMLRALAPRGDQNDPYEVRYLSSADLSYSRINDVQAVFVGHVGALSQASLQALAMYANQGGGVVFFCGDGPVKENLQALRDLDRHANILPLELLSQNDLTLEGGQALAVKSADAPPGATPAAPAADSRQLLHDFDGPARAALGQVRFTKVWFARPSNDPLARTLLTFADQSTPALAMRYVGSGKLVLANFSPSLACSDLGKHGCFVALVHAIAEYVRPQRTAAAPLAGEPLRLSVDAAGGEFAATGPDGRPCQIQTTSSSGGSDVTIVRPELPGFYRLTQGGQQLALAAVNIDPRESDLATVDQDLVFKQLKVKDLALDVRDTSAAGPILRVRGWPIWHWFVVAALCAFALELTLLAVWRR